MRQKGLRLFCVLIGIIGFNLLGGESLLFADTPPSDLNRNFWQRPENISGDDSIDIIVDRTTDLLVFWYAIVIFCLVLFCVKYRSKEGQRGYYHHGTDAKSIGLQLFVGLCVFFTVDIHLVMLSSNHLQKTFYNYPKEDPKDVETLRVEIMPQQWAWNFRYAGPDQQFNTPDDILTFNQLYIPKDRPVIVQMKARDVIHSFSLPHIRLKQDAIPGSVTRMWFKSVKAGRFEIVCAEMCGLNHYKMKGEMFVLEPKEFDAWAKRAQKMSAVSFDKDEPDSLWGWKWEAYNK